METRRRNIRLLPLHDTFLGRLRTKRREPEFACEGLSAHRSFRNEVSFELVAIVHAGFCNPIGPDIFLSVGAARKASAFESDKVHVRLVVYRSRVLPAGTCRMDDSVRSHKSALACRSLLSGGG